MKNNLIIFTIFFYFFYNNAFAESFTFKSSNIEIKDGGNFILASDGEAISADENFIIKANKFEYLKDKDLLRSFGNGTAIIRDNNLIIKFNELESNQNGSLTKLSGNIKILQSEKGIIIETDSVLYNKLDGILESQTKSTLKDKFNNFFIVDNFFYEINKDIIKLNNAYFKDPKNNIFTTSLAYINTKSNKLFGKDITVNLNNSSFNKNNDPRLKGNSITHDNENTEITKGVFTTCKKRKDKCPPWQLSAEKIQHDKKNQIINYKNAWLRIYDVPILYFPKFFHPDPTVKRKSGFLMPSIKSSNTSSNFLNTPYFFAVAENKDFTFSPRFYAEEKILFQTEYRQKNLSSTHTSDFSFFTRKGKNSKNHFFYNYNNKFDFQRFSKNNIDLKIQKTSNDTYLKAEKIKSPLIDNTDFLENSFSLDLYSNDLSIDTEFTIYEDLDKNKSDRYEYIFPKIDLVKNIDNKTNLKGDFSFRSKNLVRNFNTNVFEKSNINDLIFNSYPKITKNGFYNDYSFIIKNSNTDGQNSTNYKENNNYYLSGLFQYNTSLPLIKEKENYTNILKPKLSIKMAPSHTKDISDQNIRIDVNNLYSLNRISENDIIEGGTSLIIGNEFSIFDKQNLKEIFNFKLANNLRFTENNDLPTNNQLGQKTSNFFGEIFYSPNQFITTKYNTSIKNNFLDVSYENFITDFRINNFVTTFDYLNENNTSEKNEYLSNTTKYIIDDSNSLSFSTRENKTSDLTEYYNLVYQYKNDCLSASIEYNKEFYNDRDIKPDENIFFKLTIIPFGEASTPNLKN